MHVFRKNILTFVQFAQAHIGYVPTNSCLRANKSLAPKLFHQLALCPDGVIAHNNPYGFLSAVSALCHILSPGCI